MWAVDYFPDELAVVSAVVSAVELAAESVVDDPHFRLPTQPKVVDGWRGTGEAADPHYLVAGEGGGARVAITRTENASSEGGETAGGVGRGPGAEEEKKEKKGQPEIAQGKSEKKRKRCRRRR